MASFDDAFDGFDEAEVEERLPLLPQNGGFVLELAGLEQFTARKPAGPALAIKFKVVSSTVEGVRKGAMYGQRLLGLTDPNRKKFQFGRIKQLIGGIHNIDPQSNQKWSQLLGAMIKTGCRNGWIFSAETGPQTKSEGGFDYVPINFGPPPADADMPEKQAKAFAE